MIALHKDNLSKYLGVDPRLDAALRMLAADEISWDTLGKTEDSQSVYHITQRYETKQPEQTRWESHQKWIDIQYVNAGQERIDVLVSRQGLTEVERNAEADVQFYEEEGCVRANQLYLRAGMLAVFYPEDIHRPCICVERPQTIEKVVCKVKV